VSGHFQFSSALVIAGLIGQQKTKEKKKTKKKAKPEP